MRPVAVVLAAAAGAAVASEAGPAGCYDAVCGCPGTPSQQLRGGCSAAPPARSRGACEAAGGVWCTGAPGPRAVGSPGAFNEALREVIRGADCSTRYEVSGDLFGTLTAYDTRSATGIADLAGVPGKPLAWLAGPLGLAALLNEERWGCCGAGVRTMAACVCRIGADVGLVDSDNNVSYLAEVPPHRYVYAVIRATTTNRTGSSGSVETLVPTWPNLLDVMEATIALTLGEEAPSCAPTEEVRRALDGSDYGELFRQRRPAFEALGATEENCKIMDPALFLSHADELCTSPVVARVFLCSFLDVNPMFRGTGRTPSGFREYITIPNPDVALLQTGPAEADILEFDIPEDDGLSCER